MARMMLLGSEEAWRIEYEHLYTNGVQVSSEEERTLLIESCYDPPLCDLVVALKAGHITDFIRV